MTVEADIATVRACTAQMGKCRDLQDSWAAVRREAILRLRENGVSYERIAEVMGTSPQAVYKVLKTPLYIRRIGQIEAGEPEQLERTA